MKCRICNIEGEENFYISNRSTCKRCLIKREQIKYRLNPEYYKKAYLKFEKENLLQVRWLAAKHRAKRKNLEFTITLTDLKRLLTKQNNKCYYTNLEFINDNSRYTSVSIDRIDSSRGYTLDNIRLISSQVNLMKHERTEEEFLQTIQDIYNHTIRKPT